MPFQSQAAIFVSSFMKSTDRSGQNTEGSQVRALLSSTNWTSALGILENAVNEHFEGDPFRRDVAKYLWNLGCMASTARVTCTALSEDSAIKVSKLVEALGSRTSVVEINAYDDYITLMRPLEERLSTQLSAVKAIRRRLDDACVPGVIPEAPAADWIRALKTLSRKSFTLKKQSGVKEVVQEDFEEVGELLRDFFEKFPTWDKQITARLKGVPRGASKEDKEERRNIARRGAKRRSYFWQEILVLLEEMDSRLGALTSNRMSTNMKKITAAFIDFGKLDKHAIAAVQENEPDVTNTTSKGAFPDTDALLSSLQEDVVGKTNTRTYDANDDNHQLALLMHIMAYAGMKYSFKLQDDFEISHNNRIQAPGVMRGNGLIVPVTLHALAEYYRVLGKHAWRAVIPTPNPKHFEFLDRIISLAFRSKKFQIARTVKDESEIINRCITEFCESITKALLTGDMGRDIKDVMAEDEQKIVFYDRSLLTNLEKEVVVTTCGTDDKAFGADKNLTLEFSQAVGFIDMPRTVGHTMREFITVKPTFGFGRISSSCDLSALAAVYNSVATSQPLTKTELTLEYSPAQMIAEAVADARVKLRRLPGTASSDSLSVTDVIPGLAFKGLEKYQLFHSVMTPCTVLIDGGFDSFDVTMRSIITMGGIFSYGTYVGEDAGTARAAGYYKILANLMEKATDDFFRAYGPRPLTIENSDEAKVEMKGENSQYLERIDIINAMSEFSIKERDVAYLANSDFTKDAFDATFFDKVYDLVNEGKIYHDVTGWALLNKLASTLKSQIDNDTAEPIRDLAKKIFSDELSVADRVLLRDPAKREAVGNYFKAIKAKLGDVDESSRLVVLILLFMVVGVIDINQTNKE